MPPVHKCINTHAKCAKLSNLRALGGGVAAVLAAEINESKKGNGKTQLCEPSPAG